MGGGPHSTMNRVLASHPAAPGLNPGVPEMFSEKRILSILPRSIEGTAA